MLVFWFLGLVGNIHWLLLNKSYVEVVLGSWPGAIVAKGFLLLVSLGVDLW